MNSLTKKEHSKMKKICSECCMKGDGASEILEKVKGYLVSIGKVVAPALLKEVVVPLIVKYAKEKAGVGGSGLKLAGQGGKGVKKPHTFASSGRMVKGSQAAKDHMSKLRAMRKK
jgi:hypothetical protein